jgi:hypothetical protein
MMYLDSRRWGDSRPGSRETFSGRYTRGICHTITA